jgi:hypothetical protein
LPADTGEAAQHYNIEIAECYNVKARPAQVRFMLLDAHALTDKLKMGMILLQNGKSQPVATQQPALAE